MPIRKNIKLAKKYGAKIRYFKDLPKTHQYALIQYMVVNGAAWDVSDDLANSFEECHKIRGKFPYEKEKAILKKGICKSLSFYIEKYGNWKFGMVDIPTKVMIKAVMQEKDVKKDFESWSDYHQWYKDSGYVKHPRKNRWPSILSSFDDEVMEDGWHRFHCYAGRGDKTIPCIYYPDNCEPKKKVA